MEMQPIEPNRPMTCNLVAEQWNVVLFALRKHAMPFEISAPIIEGLTTQLQQQAQQRMTAEDVERFIPDGP
jgi:sulfur relay (sulfurtransferase) DsrC/TusE family protein